MITIWLLFVMFFGTLNQEQGWTSLIPGQRCVPLEVDYYRVLEQRKGDSGIACEEELWETALTCKQSTKHSPSARQRHIPMGFGPVPFCLQDKALTEHSHVVSQRSETAVGESVRCSWCWHDAQLSPRLVVVDMWRLTYVCLNPGTVKVGNYFVVAQIFSRILL